MWRALGGGISFSWRDLALSAVMAAVPAAFDRVTGDGGVTALDFVLCLFVLIILIFPVTYQNAVAVFSKGSLELF